MNRDPEAQGGAAKQPSGEDRAAARTAALNPTTWHRYLQHIAPSFVGLSESEAAERAEALGISRYSFIHAEESTWISGGGPFGYLTIVMENGVVARLLS